MPLLMFFRFLLVYSRGNLGKSAAVLLTIVYLANLNNFTPSFVKAALHQRSTQVLAVIGGVILAGALVLLIWGFILGLKDFLEHPVLPGDRDGAEMEEPSLEA